MRRAGLAPPVSGARRPRFRLIRAGLRGYVTKDGDTPELLLVLRLVVGGLSVFSSSVAGALVGQLRRRSDTGLSARTLPGVLTPRESKVLDLLAAGKRNQEIASARHLTERTAENHVYNIYRKLQVHDRAGAALVALRSGELAFLRSKLVRVEDRTKQTG